ncbi:hypothetical protein Goari_003093 [Gossypium aridum]|uniref:Uncharacterized protein n=1 Tax=Gossypium aridum TaxID=34290 RepID=A0A7J8YAG8_GOSAI|nr:hypothetical protein [Gossypium aridum]
MMKNVKGGKGLFASIMVVTRQFVGKKGSISLIRGKAIALHSQADIKQKQGLIRLAKKNGERLGFLA